MRLRITTEPERDRTIVRVDGELVNEGVAELQRVCSKVETALFVDLAGLDRVDTDGVQLLNTLGTRGARLLGVNPYISLLLRECAGR